MFLSTYENKLDKKGTGQSRVRNVTKRIYMIIVRD